MGEASEALFNIFGLKVTAEVTTMWAIMLILVVISAILSRNLKEKPGVFQNMVEMALEKLLGFFSGVIGEKKARKYFPFLATLFIFIIVANYSGLIPGSGIIKGFKAPTASLSVTAGLALVVFFATHIFGIKENGFKGYLKHYIKPVFFMLPFLIIEEVVRPLSLSLRLYGNIFGEESVTEQLYEILPIGAPLIMMVLSLLFCAIQAVVFTMLTSIYIDDVTDKEE